MQKYFEDPKCYLMEDDYENFGNFFKYLTLVLKDSSLFFQCETVCPQDNDGE